MFLGSLLPFPSASAFSIRSIGKANGRGVRPFCMVTTFCLPPTKTNPGFLRDQILNITRRLRFSSCRKATPMAWQSEYSSPTRGTEVKIPRQSDLVRTFSFSSCTSHSILTRDRKRVAICSGGQKNTTAVDLSKTENGDLGVYQVCLWISDVNVRIQGNLIQSLTRSKKLMRDIFLTVRVEFER